MTRWYTEKKKERFYKEAKRVGYRARSAFKLKQIQGRFHCIPKDSLVVDLGAAPGGWSQVAKELVGPQGIVIGADLSSIQPLEDVVFIQGDITKVETVQKIKEKMNGKNADIVLSDMSPDISGNYSVDQARSVWLCENAFNVVQEILRPGGHFICKIFEGEDMKSFVDKIKRQFMVVKIFSPEASRKSSSEVYIVAKSFKKLYKESSISSG
ncbi:MAG: RlmE family RNA methyltransferase [Candidatus Thermoplasmatota archaeon]|nr:RlmE family RNA methyltransferase [Candidatus Thermoplasmatota archaeon]